MKQCTQGTKFKRVGGRQRQYISYEDFVEPPPTPTMLRLAAMKNEGYSWRSLAEELQTFSPDATISHSLVRRVTLGYCKSERIDYALGIRTAPPPVEVAPCPTCGKVHKIEKLCKPRPAPEGKVRFSFWVDEDERDAIRAAVDSHPDGRTAWLREHADVQVG